MIAANERVLIPEDVAPPLYTAAGGAPTFLPDGSVFVIHDDEWAAIPFYRPPECVPLDFNLLEGSDPNALDCPLLVEGFAEFKDASDPGPILTELNGRGAIPVWFVRYGELTDAMADGELTILELLSLESLQIGSASFYHEQNHIFGLHEVSHLTVAALGMLEDGRLFQLQAVEVDLEIVIVRIAFE
jgi:hypothetical protein